MCAVTELYTDVDQERQMSGQPDFFYAADKLRQKEASLKEMPDGIPSKLELMP